MNSTLESPSLPLHFPFLYHVKYYLTLPGYILGSLLVQLYIEYLRVIVSIKSKFGFGEKFAGKLDWEGFLFSLFVGRILGAAGKSLLSLWVCTAVAWRFEIV